MSEETKEVEITEEMESELNSMGKGCEDEQVIRCAENRI